MTCDNFSFPSLRSAGCVTAAMLKGDPLLFWRRQNKKLTFVRTKVKVQPDEEQWLI